MFNYSHKPVLLKKVIEALNIHAEGYYIDSTFGRGGHSRAILQRLGSEGRLLAFDKDLDAIKSLGNDLKQDPRFEIIQGSFTMLMQQTIQRNIKGHIAGILFDLGVSSPQFDDPSRGFSFRFDGPLDMRMDMKKGKTVADWLNLASEKDIANVIYQYGEERKSRFIAKAIVKARERKRITRTAQLTSIISQVLPAKKGNIHPSTKTFQALRIFINSELNDIKEALPKAVDVLRAGGRLVVISFHSLEDRIVKRFMRKESTIEDLPFDLPLMPDQRPVKLKVIGKKIRPSEQEIDENPRARSAILRIAERCI